jgi:hypothetical protein
VVGPDGETATLTLSHPDHTEAADATTASFALTRSASTEGARRALDRLSALITENDPGGFYRIRAHAAPRRDQGATVRAESLRAWLLDGTLWCTVGAVLLAVFVVRELRRAPRTTVLLFVAIVLLNASVRVALAEETVLGAWPFSRTTALTRFIWEGPLLSHLARFIGRPLGFFEVVMTANLAFACLTPLSIFLHAKKLLGTDRIALLATLALAALPNHIRFSHSEVEFIPSIALSSYSFALTHIAMKDSEGVFRRIALVALPFVLGVTLLARPLNQIYLALLLVTALYMCRHQAPLGRRLVVAAVLVVVAAWVFVDHFWPYYHAQVVDGLDAETLSGALVAIFTPRWNTLIHFWVTPPGMTLLALLGGWLAIRSREADRRDAGLYVTGWLGFFFVTSAYVLPEEVAMQARYHLDLAVPFCMLAALGIEEIYRRKRVVAELAIAYVALSPLVHLDFVRDVAFNDPLEYAFVTHAKEKVGEGCFVLEYAGAGTGDVDVRFARLGSVIEAGAEKRLYTSIPIGADAQARDPLRPEVRALLADPPACLIYYEGLFCYGRKERDEPIAPACQAMREAAPLETLDATEIANRPYDGNLALGLRWPTSDAERERLRLSVYRVGALR